LSYGCRGIEAKNPFLSIILTRVESGDKAMAIGR